MEYALTGLPLPIRIPPFVSMATERGLAFDSSTDFTLPDGSMRSPGLGISWQWYALRQTNVRVSRTSTLSSLSNCDLLLIRYSN